MDEQLENKTTPNDQRSLVSHALLIGVGLLLMTASFFVGISIQFKDMPRATEHTMSYTAEELRQCRESLAGLLSSAQNSPPDIPRQCEGQYRVQKISQLPVITQKNDAGLPLPTTVIARHDFTFQGASGSVYQTCDFGHIVFADDPICLGEGALMFEWGGELREIARLDTPTLESAKLLQEIGFNEGQYSVSADSSSDEATLFISMNDLVCLPRLQELCMNDWDLMYRIDFPSLVVTKLPTNNSSVYFTELARFNWNESGTKGVYNITCAEGCPEVRYASFDVATGIFTPLFTDKEVGMIMSDPDDVVWVDEDTVRIEGKEKSM